MVARWLGPRDYGVLALITAYPATIFAVLDARSAFAIVKYLGEFRERGELARGVAVVRGGYVVDAAVAAAGLVVVLASAGWAEGAIVGAPSTASLVVVAAVTFVGRFPVATAQAALTTFHRFRLISILQVLFALIRSGIIVALVGWGGGVAQVIWTITLTSVFEGVLFFLVTRTILIRELGRHPIRESWGHLGGRRREIARFLLWTDLDGLFSLVGKRLDLLLLGFFRGPVEAGYYRFASSVAGLAGNVVNPLQSVAFPRLVQSATRSGGRSPRALAFRYAVKLGIPLGSAALLSVLFLPWAVPAVGGNGYAKAVPAVQLLVAGGAVWIAFFWLRPLLLSVGKAKAWSLTLGAMSIAAGLGYVIIIPWHGFVGAAWIRSIVFGAAVHVMGVALVRASPKASSAERSSVSG